MQMKPMRLEDLQAMYGPLDEVVAHGDGYRICMLEHRLNLSVPSMGAPLMPQGEVLNYREGLVIPGIADLMQLRCGHNAEDGVLFLGEITVGRGWDGPIWYTELCDPNEAKNIMYIGKDRAGSSAGMKQHYEDCTTVALLPVYANGSFARPYQSPSTEYQPIVDIAAWRSYEIFPIGFRANEGRSCRTQEREETRNKIVQVANAYLGL